MASPWNALGCRLRMGMMTSNVLPPGFWWQSPKNTRMSSKGLHEGEVSAVPQLPGKPKAPPHSGALEASSAFALAVGPAELFCSRLNLGRRRWLGVRKKYKMHKTTEPSTIQTPHVHTLSLNHSVPYSLHTQDVWFLLPLNCTRLSLAP